MADLNVEPKSGRPWWMWVLIAIAVIAVILFLVRGCDSDDEITDSEAPKIENTEGGTSLDDE